MLLCEFPKSVLKCVFFEGVGFCETADVPRDQSRVKNNQEKLEPGGPGLAEYALLRILGLEGVLKAGVRRVGLVGGLG